jgi:hypothetical protein
MQWGLTAAAMRSNDLVSRETRSPFLNEFNTLESFMMDMFHVKQNEMVSVLQQVIDHPLFTDWTSGQAR